MEPINQCPYFQPNLNWSFYLLESDTILVKVARATLFPFIFIASLESLLSASQFIMNLSILLANKISLNPLLLSKPIQKLFQYKTP